ncbi:MAG: hypothetical protein KIT09_08840 [Bryobacteraceae bacterium]|nr:hypothetical protein [Bryobacteraceae bacterium]
MSIHGPWQVASRTAVLSPWFPVNGGARVFFEFTPLALARFRPGVIAGPVEALRDLARRSMREGAVAPLPDFGLIAFTGRSRTPLTESDRDLFWRAFQAPVFEQYRDDRGRLLAAECEARQGLHILGEDAPRALDAFRLAHEPCACGLKSPRLVVPPAEPIPLPKAAAAGA